MVFHAVFIEHFCYWMILVGAFGVACRDPEFIRQAARRFGSQCVVVNIDPKRVQKDGREFWEVHINGGRIGTGREAVAWAREVQRLGAGEIVLTSMDADGTKAGYDIELTAAVVQAVNIPVIGTEKEFDIAAVPAEFIKLFKQVTFRFVFIKKPGQMNIKFNTL